MSLFFTISHGPDHVFLRFDPLTRFGSRLVHALGHRPALIRALSGDGLYSCDFPTAVNSQDKNTCHAYVGTDNPTEKLSAFIVSVCFQ